MGFQFTNKSPLLIYNNCEYYIFVLLIFIPAAAFSRKTQLHKDRKIPPRQAPVLSIACLEGIIATPLPPGYEGEGHLSLPLVFYVRTRQNPAAEPDSKHLFRIIFHQKQIVFNQRG